MGGGGVILLAVQASARRTIVAWTLYDFANSAFAAVVLSTVYPAYYANVVVGNADGRGDFWWGAAVSTAMVIGALTSPPLGGIADHAGARWNFCVAFSVVSIAATALMAPVGPGRVWWGWVLAVVGIVTYEAAFVYYTSYLPRIAPPERIGRVSAAGFAVGYAGSLVAFAAAYPFAAAHAYGGCFVAAAALFAVFSIPAFVILPADARHPMRLATAATRGVGETLVTLREILRDPARAQMRRFLTAYLVYEDGVNTVVTFAGVFAAKTLGFTFTEIIALFMLVQVTALLRSAAWARPSDSRGPRCAGRDRLGGALLRRRARAAGPRERRRADGGRARAPRGSAPVEASEPVNESQNRGAPRLGRGASERWGGVGGHVGAPRAGSRS